MEFDDYSRLLLADIPGTIEEAHADKGLGLAFLKHIERTSALIYVIEMAPWQDRDPYEEFIMLQRELEAYNPEMLKKPFLVVLNKIDQEETAPLIQLFREKYSFDPSNLFEISALNGIGTDALKKAIQQLSLSFAPMASFAGV